MAQNLMRQRREAAAYDAAVVKEHDYGAHDVARVVPADATVLRFKKVEIGYLKDVERKAGLPVECWPLFERRRELHQLVQGRRRDGVIDDVPPEAWCVVLANLAACFSVYHYNAPRDIEAGVYALCDWIGIRRIDKRWLEPVIRDTEIAARVWTTYKLSSPDDAGALLRVTRDERTDYGLVKIGSMDEDKHQRRRRLDRERKRKKDKPETLKAQAARLGISVATLKRRRAAK